MKIIHKTDAVHVPKPQSVEVDYYLFDDYEVHYNEQLPHTTQDWHHHDVIWETLYIVDGELTAYWRENAETKSRVVKAGDLIETERSSHTFANESDGVVRFLVLKRVPSDENYRAVFKNDKILDDSRTA